LFYVGCQKSRSFPSESWGRPHLPEPAASVV
jgi:hypothetical protein